MSEKVLCVPDSSVLWPRNDEEWNPYFNFLSWGEAEFIDREAAEINPDFRQLIPTVVIRCKADDTYFVYQRAGSERRLSGRDSILIGGHIEPKDSNAIIGPECIFRCLDREIREELGVSPKHRPYEYLGVIKSNATLLDAVHMGLLYEYAVDEKFIPKVSEEIAQWAWLPYTDLEKNPANHEKWFGLALKAIKWGRR